MKTTMETIRIPGTNIAVEESNTILLAKCYQKLSVNYKDFIVGTISIIEQVTIITGFGIYCELIPNKIELATTRI